MSKFDVVNMDGDTVATFATRELAEAEIAATVAEYTAEHPLDVREGNRPILNVQERSE